MSIHSKHVQTQQDLFNKEFANINTLEPEPWQISYIQRIETYLFKKNKNKKGSLIELGCGDGRLSVHFAKKGFEVTACDISDKSVELAKTFAKQAKVNMHVKQCDVTHLPFKDHSFDYAIAGAILEHLEDEETALKEWARVLKPGGRIFIVTPVRQRHVFPLWWVLNWFHDRRLGHVRRYDTKRYESFQKYGLFVYKTLFTGHTPKVILTILYMLLKKKQLQLFAERIDELFVHMEYDANNITGFFEKR